MILYSFGILNHNRCRVVKDKERHTCLPSNLYDRIAEAFIAHPISMIMRFWMYKKHQKLYSISKEFNPFKIQVNAILVMHFFNRHIQCFNILYSAESRGFMKVMCTAIGRNIKLLDDHKIATIRMQTENDLELFTESEGF